MYELNPLGPKSWYISCPAKIGVYKPAEESNEVYLIDSGNDKDAGRRVRKVLDEQGWVLKGILNTHSNADHVGGNQYLQKQTGCHIFAKGIEAACTRFPILEPSFLFGAFPPKELRHKFLLAPPSDAKEITDPLFPAEVQVIDLPGHFFDMVGFALPDGTVFLADCVSSAYTLEKYQVSFIYDVEAYLETLDKICTLEGKLFVPSHADVTEDISELAALNKEKVLEIAELLMGFCAKEGQTAEQVLARLFNHYGLNMDFEQYALVGSTVRSYLSWLLAKGRLKTEFRDNLLYWQSV